MPYDASKAIAAFKRHASGFVSNYRTIKDTKDRGLAITLNTGETVVVFIYPLVHKQDNTKNYFDTRDSGPYERAVAWNYALTNNYKYFCFGINDSVDKYVDYIFSLECEESKIQELSGTVNGQRAGKGNQIIIPNDYVPSKQFHRFQNKLGVFICAIHKDALSEYIQKYDNRPYLLDKNIVPLPEEIDKQEAADLKEYLSGGTNILLYGVPGCGKSHTIKTEFCDDDSHMERVVFHPDYTYSDFVGQILPKVDNGHIEYRFEAGPFTRIIKMAFDTPSEYFYLIVEEINRGNAPAIFGDVFQLMDRDESGWSEYGVSNENMAEYVHGDKSIKIKIPGNLFVLATMNTSDQNVFTLDTAFKRRWSLRMIENDIGACKFAGQQICNSDITWGVFAKTINQKIIEFGENNLSNEDNRLGAYFVREADLKDASLFAEKVLMYLWNDAFKFDHDKVFRPDYRTLDELIHAFIQNGFDVFNDDIVFEKQETDQEEQTAIGTYSVEKYLEGKNPELVAIYQMLFSAVKERIPNAYDSSVGSYSYASWRANDIKKASFADVTIKRDGISIQCEQPTSDELKVVGESFAIDNHHNHYFKINFDAEKMDLIVEAIVDSYNQLKVQQG